MSAFTMPVQNYMSSPVHGIDADATLVAARRRLKELGVSSLPVLDDDGQLLGVLTRSDLLRIGRLQAGARQGAALLVLPEQAVSQAMTPQVVTVTPDDPLVRAARAMVEQRIHRVFVTDGGEVLGVLSTRDIMRAIAEARVRRPIAAFMSSPVFTVRIDEPLSLAADRLQKAEVHGLVVVEDGWPVGVFTQEEALQARHLPRESPVESSMGHALLCLETDTPLHRAAAQAAAMDVRRIVAMKDRLMQGVLTGIDLAGAILA